MYSKSCSLLLTLTSAVILLAGCMKDKCTTHYTYQIYEPVYLDYAQLRQPVASEAPRALKHPGKIYILGGFLFINEVNEGVHVIDNSNPAAPVNKAFISIPGNVDIAVRSNILYADSYVDLVAVDITNPENVAEIKRLENIFPQRIADLGYYYADSEKGVITGWRLTDKTQVIDIPCGQEAQPYYYYWGGLPEIDFAGPVLAGNTQAPSITNATINVGQGGSMARFAIVSDYLYVIDNSDMQLISIANPDNPVIWTKINIGFNIETIFPYKDKLFIGSTTGMYIYDNSNPSQPTQISTFSHVTSCDPVVADDRYAYVTLRSGTPCQGFTNQLEVIDISNPYNPQLVKTYAMYNPHGIGIDRGKLFICDGQAGLKIYDASDVSTIDQHLLLHNGNIHAYDVIPVATSNVLILIGQDGLYQYDYSDVRAIRLLSHIPVN
ncbi:MAG: hypothetical protein KatS3mg031_2207 [Chitinophagales bacterium]|nr:MAG: hypothetical protein KatS3mg031_2207 [Chitinophagales bacterium]